jgi:cyclase
MVWLCLKASRPGNAINNTISNSPKSRLFVSIALRSNADKKSNLLMATARVIPCLLLKNGGLCKTVKFSNPRYVGDPINAVKIFNEKEVDELVFLDIEASRLSKAPDFQLITDIVSEAFMPFAYGGGISTVEQARMIFDIGVEKVVLNSNALSNPDLVSDIVALAGSSSVVVALDVKKNWLGHYSVWSNSGTVNSGRHPSELAAEMERRGAGEIFLTSIDHDGIMGGYDLKLIELVSKCVSVPVIICGGAGSFEHFAPALRCGASAVAGGSMFIYHGKHRAVLITYPDYSKIETLTLGGGS